MTTCFLAPDPVQSTFLLPGTNTPGNGVQLFTYTAGTTTKATVYKDSLGAASWTDPIVLDSGGNLPSGGSVWIATGIKIKAVWAPFNDTDPPGSPFRTIDNISGVNDVSSTLSEWILGPAPTFIGTTQFSLAGDQTLTFTVGRRIKATVSAGTIYGTITVSSFGAGVTTVTVALDAAAVFDGGLSVVWVGILDPTNPSTVYLNAIRCTVSGTANAILLTPIVGVASPAYANGQKYVFTPTAISTGNVTLKVGPNAALNAYAPDGIARIAEYDLMGSQVEFMYMLALNAGAGGFLLVSPPLSPRQTYTQDCAIRLSALSSTSIQLGYSLGGNGTQGNGLFLYDAVAARIRYMVIPGTTGTMSTTTNNCFVEGVGGQSLVNGTIYSIYAFVSSSALAVDFSTTAPSFADTQVSPPIPGVLGAWGSKNGDFSRRYIGITQPDAGTGAILVSGGPAPNGVIGVTVASLFNRQRITMNAQVLGSTTASSWTAAGITNGKLTALFFPDGEEPMITFSGSLNNMTSSPAINSVGVLVNGIGTPACFATITTDTAGQHMPFSLTLPAGSPNYTTSTNTYQVQLQTTAGTVSLDGGCFLVGSFAI